LAVEGGRRGDEVLDACEVGVRAGGALGARRRLVELRLLWMDWASRRLSKLSDDEWVRDEGGGCFLSRRR